MLQNTGLDAKVVCYFGKRIRLKSSPQNALQAIQAGRITQRSSTTKE